MALPISKLYIGAVPMPAHYDQIGVERIRLIQNLLGHRSGPLVQTDFDAGLRDFFLPLHKLRFLAFILWNCLRASSQT